MLAGDESAMRAVYRDVQPRLLRYLTVLVGPHDAEDVASETWAQAFRDLGRFTGDADGFRGWVTTIGRHRALDHLRRRPRQPRADSELLEALDRPADIDVEAAVIGTLSTEAALELVASLPPDQAEAIVLRTMFGFDAPTTARILGKRPGAVRSASHRGLRALARKLDREAVKKSAPTRNTSPAPDAEGTR
ncbi:RNA polymerase subunit sigma-24 [Nocardioides currus]|uniref:RNA polymerase subunit sigma-24 n=2 Tax=Nocardioides currus TaxID=2133958 RepID=A0A2R7YYR0_9ACTN|nr:RNA polymerase subunit sigma-24 [Nocardioides currus]